jgi:lipoate-protein ligase B
LRIQDLGRLAYAEALDVQNALVEARLRGDVPDTLLLVEHPPVITLGRRGSTTDVLTSPDELARRNIELRQATRGGLVTYHGPGQLVGYPIVHLRQLGLRVPEYAHGLEAAIVDALAELGICAHTDCEHVGVWTDTGKIAAIGIAQRHGVAYHGFAVNLQPDLSHFGLINPCGIGERGVTSAAELLGRPVSLAEFKPLIVPRITDLCSSAAPRPSRPDSVAATAHR